MACVMDLATISVAQLSEIIVGTKQLMLQQKLLSICMLACKYSFALRSANSWRSQWWLYDSSGNTDTLKEIITPGP